MALSCLLPIPSSHSKKNKAVSRGILLYHSFYKPYHMQNLSPREQQIVGAIVESCKSSEVMHISLSDFLQQQNTSFSSFELQCLLHRLSSEVGVSLQRDKESLFLYYNPVLHVQ